MTSAAYARQYREQLYAVYETGEADAITELVWEHYTGKTRNERLKEPGWLIPAAMITAMDAALGQLLNHRPVQYVLHEAWFCGHRFFVDGSVLIPRPETELLVEEAIRRIKELNKEHCRVLDIGTGSGCIPISIKKKLPNAEVWAMDISAVALVTAKKNAELLNAEIHFKEAGITDTNMWDEFPEFDIVVSNPPYIPHSNIAEMNKNVTEYEPHEALFVPGNDALFFYRHITAFCKKKLLPAGKLLCEIHEEFGKDVADWFSNEGFEEVEVMKDLFGKERIVAGTQRTPKEFENLRI